jgi:uncharacterized membrane protein
VAHTFTNIGTSYVDVYSALFEPDNNVIDFTNATQFRILYEWDYVGVGTQTVRWVNKANVAEVLWTSAGFTADQDPGDSGWQNLPAAFSGAVVKTIKMQAVSTTAADDPVAHGFRIFLK